MPEYLAPGVYLDEITSGSRTIEGVDTTTTGLLGEASRGPIRPTLVRSWTEFGRRYGGFIDGRFGSMPGYLPYAVRGFFQNGGTRLVVARAASRAAGTASLSVAGPSGALELRAVGPGTWGNDVHVTVEPSAADPELFALKIEYADGSESFEHLSTDPSHPEYAMAIVNPASELVEITACPNGPPGTVVREALRGGTDAPAALEDFVGGTTSEPATGLGALTGINGISLLAAPDDVAVEGLAAAVIESCESRRDRFAVTAAPHPERPAAQVRPVRASGWGATYHPWLRVDASHLPAGTALIPAHGHICGIYARVDTAQGVHRPPSAQEVQGIIGLSHRLTQAEQEILNPRGVNVIRDFRPQRGVLVWGGRTMVSDADWKYVNVRRLFIFIERSIQRGLQWVVFEPNVEPTWLEVRRSIEAFLTKLWRDGALVGQTVERAFYVRCDRRTMTQADIDAGRLVCEIGVAPIRPAEFLLLRLTVRTASDDGP